MKTTQLISEQFLNGTFAHNRPFQCHSHVKDNKTITNNICIKIIRKRKLKTKPSRTTLIMFITGH